MCTYKAVYVRPDLTVEPSVMTLWWVLTSPFYFVLVSRFGFKIQVRIGFRLRLG